MVQYRRFFGPQLQLWQFSSKQPVERSCNSIRYVRSVSYGVLRYRRRKHLAIVFPVIVFFSLLCPLVFATQDSQIAQARRLLAAGSYNQASHLLEETLNRRPDDADVHLLLGQVYAVEGRRTDSIQQFTRSNCVRILPPSMTLLASR